MASSSSEETAAPARAERDGGALSAPHLPRPPRQSRWWRALVAFLAVGLIVAWMAWYAQTPDPLPTDDEVVEASGVVGSSLYIGMFTVPDGFDRTLHVSGVKLSTHATADVTVTPHLCRQGTIGVTTAPDQFCADLIDPAGTTLSSGDSIIVEILAESPTLAEVERISIGFREGLRWGTEEAGHAGARISLIASGGRAP